MIAAGSSVVFNAVPEDAYSVVFEVIEVHDGYCKLRDPLGEPVSARFPLEMLQKSKREYVLVRKVSS